MIKKLQAGDSSIPASGWNEMRAFIQDYSFPQDTFKSPPRNPAYISIKNVTSAALPALSIVKISTPIYTRSGDTFKNKGVEYGVEMNGAAPSSDSDNIAVIQESIRPGCIGRAICSGATPCIVNKAANKAYKYAKPVTSQTGYLEGTDDVTNYRVLWIATGTGNKEAFICIDASAEPEYFIINKGWSGTGTPPNDPTVYKKGTLHYVTFDGDNWIPHSSNESTSVTSAKRPVGSKLVVCQKDAPSDAKDFHMPYFTPESNMGVPPAYSSSFQFSWGETRCGVVPGEHTFTDKMYDYNVTFNSGVNTGSSGNSSASASYEYEPQFTAIVTASDTYGGAGVVYAELNNNDHWQISFPSAVSGLSAACYPDIYPLDELVVEINCERQLCLALDYSTDYESGTIMAFYGYAPGRGWEEYSTPAALSNIGFKLYLKVKTDALL